MELHKDEGSSADLARHRINTAIEDLQAAECLLRENQYRASNNRAYYAIYRAINAVHALNHKAYRRHKDAIGNFNRDYIHTEIFPKGFGRRIALAEEIRHASDYDDFYVASKTEAQEMIETARELIDLVRNYIDNKLA